jgi:hypothetical protein
MHLNMSEMKRVLALNRVSHKERAWSPELN